MSLYTTCALYFLPFLSLSSRASFLLIFKTPLPLEFTLVVKYSPLNLTDTFLPAKSLPILIGTFFLPLYLNAGFLTILALRPHNAILNLVFFLDFFYFNVFSCMNHIFNLNTIRYSGIFTGCCNSGFTWFPVNKY